MSKNQLFVVFLLNFVSDFAAVCFSLELLGIGRLLFSPVFLTASPLDSVMSSSFFLVVVHTCTGTFSSICNSS